MTPDSYTDQGTKIVGTDYNMLSSNEHHGRRRVCFFSYTVPAGGEADGNIVFACKVPEGARILGGEIVQDAAGAGAQVDVGLAGFDESGYLDLDNSVADDDDFFGAALDIAAAGKDAFAETIAQNYGYVLTKACWLALTVENAAWAAGTIVKGSVEYAVD